MAMIEHGLASAIAFVSRPVGAAAAAIALTGVVAGGLYVKNWWDGIQALDETVTTQQGTITTLRTDLQTSERNAAEARSTYERRITDLQNQNAVSQNEARNQRIRAARLTARLEELQHEQTGPLAPVLIRALDGVRDDLRGTIPVA